MRTTKEIWDGYLNTTSPEGASLYLQRVQVELLLEIRGLLQKK